MNGLPEVEAKDDAMLCENRGHFMEGTFYFLDLVGCLLDVILQGAIDGFVEVHTRGEEVCRK